MILDPVSLGSRHCDHCCWGQIVNKSSSALEPPGADGRLCRETRSHLGTKKSGARQLPEWDKGVTEDEQALMKAFPNTVRPR
jgi:hypothetical protein